MSSKKEAEFLDYCSLSQAEMIRLAKGTDKDREAATRPFSTVTTEQVQKIQPMNPFSHLLCILFLAFGVPNGVFTLPPLIYMVGRLVVGNVQATFMGALLLLIPLSFLPQPFVPSSLQSWMAVQIIKYFSFRIIVEERVQDTQGHIFVAPPHGVFPYGNLLAMLLFPSLMGFPFKGLAASSALRFPIFRQVLCAMGVIDASRNTARNALEEGHSIGISTGGVREVFETNAEHECILLKERKGMIKLAIRTGAELVPTYMFGNTKALSCWAGEGIPGGRNILERISRKVGFALIIIYGRLGLPIPYRVPILCVMGKPIPTKHIQCEEPTVAQIDEIQAILLKEMTQLFERYKAIYGWENTELIIK
jgi:1-acyl-sn-glycerol-3-phosphate acyltransferase